MIFLILLVVNFFVLSFSSPHLYGKYNQHGHPHGVTEPGDDCRKFTRFHESFLKAGASFDQTCAETSLISKYCNFSISKKDLSFLIIAFCSR